MMGNKASVIHQDKQGTNRRMFSVHSDDGYIPMTVAMRKAMIEGKKFRQVIPSNTTLTKNEVTQTNSKCNNNNVKEFPLEQKKTVSFKDLQCKQTVSSSDQVSIGNNEVITTNTIKATGYKQYKYTNKAPKDNSYSSSLSTISSAKVTIDQKKSKFTMQLEDRLRQSKLELGFDTDLDSLKEFVFKWSEVEGKKKSGLLKKAKPTELVTKLSSTCALDSTSKYVTSVPLDKTDNNVLKESVGHHVITNVLGTISTTPFHQEGDNVTNISKQSSTFICQISGERSQERTAAPKYGAHSCQILGLCSVERPKIAKPSVNTFSSNVSNQLEYITTDNVINWKQGKHDKQDCNCELCTLAYLTDMGMPTQYIPPSPKTKTPSRSCLHRNFHYRNKEIERIRIIECDGSNRSVDISVNGSASPTNFHNEASEDNSINSKLTLSAFQYDSTNQKIRRMFEQNNSSAAETHIYRGRLDSNKMNIPKRALRSKAKVDTTSAEFNKKPAGSSSSMFSATLSSSLSTVMSYSRVKLLFQNIINKNKSRKRTRKNVHKFKEMEELGLGKLKNNRWYPSGHKTYSIWNNMHAKVSGVQAEFKIYPKSYIKNAS